MSASAISNTDTESSSILSRGDNRSLTPIETAEKQRDSADRQNWDISHSSTHSPSGDSAVDHKVQLPSISTTFEDSPLHDSRRSSLPVLHSESRVRHAPYPPSNLRQNYGPSGQQTLSSYSFPSSVVDSSGDRFSARPRVSTDLATYNNGNGSHVAHSYDSPYPNSGSFRLSLSYFDFFQLNIQVFLLTLNQKTGIPQPLALSGLVPLRGNCQILP